LTVVTLVVALLVSGIAAREAFETAEDFIRPLDCYGEVSEALRRSLDDDSGPIPNRGSASETLRTAVRSVRTANSLGDCVARVTESEGTLDSVAIAGQLAAVAHALK